MSKDVNFKKISAYQGPKKSPGFILWQISTSWRSHIEEALKTFNLTHPQFVILACLGWLTREDNRVTQAEVGKMACLDPNTTSQIFKGLEKKDLVKREQSADKRAKNPSLTEHGKDVLTKALPVVEKYDQKFFRSLSQKDMDALISIFLVLTTAPH